MTRGRKPNPRAEDIALPFPPVDGNPVDIVNWSRFASVALHDLHFRGAVYVGLRVGGPEIGELADIGQAVVDLLIKHKVIESGTAVVECRVRRDRTLAAGVVRLDLRQTWPAHWRPKMGQPKLRSAVEATA